MPKIELGPCRSPVSIQYRRATVTDTHIMRVKSWPTKRNSLNKDVREQYGFLQNRLYWNFTYLTLNGISSCWCRMKSAPLAAAWAPAGAREQNFVW